MLRPRREPRTSQALLLLLTLVERTAASAHAAHDQGGAWLPLAVLAAGQLVSWGTLNYGITFLAAPVQASTGWAREFVFFGYSFALFVSGILLPWAGRLAHRRGARASLTAGAGVASAGLLVLASATGRVGWVSGWLLVGAAMALSLYEAAFSAASELQRLPLRRAIGLVTVVGGLASTVFWPITSLLVEAYGWRGTLVAFGAVHALGLAPLYWSSLPRSPARLPAPPATPEPLSRKARSRISWFSTAFGAFAFVSAGVFAHLASFMVGVERELTSFALGLIGPAQIGLRLVDMMASPARQTFGLGLGSALALAAASLLLAVVGAHPVVAIAFAVSFGVANGGMTLVRGIVPRDYFDSGAYPPVLAALSRSTLFARALGPVVTAAAFSMMPGSGVLMAYLSIALAAAVLFFIGARRPADPDAPGQPTGSALPGDTAPP